MLYNSADLVSAVTTPDPRVTGGSPQTTQTIYNNMLHARSVVQPDNTTVYSMMNLHTPPIARVVPTVL